MILIRNFLTAIGYGAVAAIGLSSVLYAQTLEPPYDDDYTLHDLGAVPGLPAPYGGLAFKAGDPNTLRIGGSANTGSGQIYDVALVRDVSNHVIGFSGSAVASASAPNIDGGLAYGPSGLVFFTGFPTNTLGQLKSGSSMPDKTVDLTAAGILPSVGALGFVPPGFPGAGQFKVVSYTYNTWYSVVLQADGNGTFDVASVSADALVTGGAEGFVYVPTASPEFTTPSILLSEYLGNRVSVYTVDDSGNPTGSPVPFISNLTGAQGAALDPLTGDFLFSTFGGGDRVMAVRGFAPPQTPTCGNGDLDSGEQCDDGNQLSGDCCDSACQYEASDNPCPDGDACNGSEACNGAGECSASTPLNCDDSDACTADSCDPTEGCINDDAPATGCLTPGKSIVLIKSNASDHSKDKLLWKWIKGAELPQVDLADPTSTASYTLCVYAGVTSELIAGAELPPGPSWSEIGEKGYKFKGISADGLSFALLKSGAAGKSKALAKGKGTALPDPTLPVAYPVTVQLKKDGSPLCLESSFTSLDQVKNTDTQFKAKK